MTPEEAFALFVEQREVFTIIAPFWAGDYEVSFTKNSTLFGTNDEGPKFTVWIKAKGDLDPIQGIGEAYSIVDAARGAVKSFREALEKREQDKREKEMFYRLHEQKFLEKLHENNP